MRMWFYCPRGCTKTVIDGTEEEPPTAWAWHCDFCDELLTTDSTEYKAAIKAGGDQPEKT
jgi:hypothetical protein